jgi:hypothetical protein
MGEFVRTSEKGGFEVQEYNGKWSLASAWEGKDGTVRVNWGKRQMGKDQYAEKATPIKVDLGDEKTATGALLSALKQITGKDFSESTPF